MICDCLREFQHASSAANTQCAENRYRGDIDTFFSNFEYCGLRWPRRSPSIEILQVDLRLRPRTASEVVFEVAASNDHGGRILGRGLEGSQRSD